MATLNYLQLTKRLQMECGVSGAPYATVQNLTGEPLRLATWINAAWLDIQAIHEDWQWLRVSTSFVTVSGQGQYTLAQCNTTNFGLWQRDTFRNYNTAAGTSTEIFMPYVDYEEWRDGYLFGALRQTKTRPFVASIAPDKSICLGPIPDVGYTVTADYFTKPVDLVLDADTPTIPDKFNMAIVYRAMMFYGDYEAAPEVISRGASEFHKQLRRMECDRLPEVMTCGSLI